MSSSVPRSRAAHAAAPALKIWDISPAVDVQAAVLPGDAAYSQKLHFALAPGCPVNVNTLTFSPHTGAHADAPMHYANGASAIGAVDPNRMQHWTKDGSGESLLRSRAKPRRSVMPLQ